MPAPPAAGAPVQSAVPIQKRGSASQPMAAPPAQRPQRWRNCNDPLKSNASRKRKAPRLAQEQRQRGASVIRRVPSRACVASLPQAGPPRQPPHSPGAALGRPAGQARPAGRPSRAPTRPVILRHMAPRARARKKLSSRGHARGLGPDGPSIATGDATRS
jgi:hypothetical protein